LTTLGNSIPKLYGAISGLTEGFMFSVQRFARTEVSGYRDSLLDFTRRSQRLRSGRGETFFDPQSLFHQVPFSQSPQVPKSHFPRRLTQIETADFRRYDSTTNLSLQT
jgi:hypothetical protein